MDQLTSQDILPIGTKIRKVVEYLIEQDKRSSLYYPIPYCRFINCDNNNFFGIQYTNQKLIDFIQLRKFVMEIMGKENGKIIQIIGDSYPFSEIGTVEAYKFVSLHLQGDYILEYGYTGYAKNNLYLDTNSIVNSYIDNYPEISNRVIANIVNQSVDALEIWECDGSSKVNNFVVVYNNGNNTKFGDDIIISDNLLHEHGDFCLMLEGGAQSFRQSINMLQNGICIKAIFNIREPDRQAFFSTTEFFYLVKSALEKDSSMEPEAVQIIFDRYMENHEAWDQKKPDSGTKEKLFYDAVDQFINKKVYMKLINHVEIVKK
jgi:hypothetical protein